MHSGAYSPDRLAWADVAKGLCIVLVVLHHEVAKDLASLALRGAPLTLDAWSELDMALLNLRMPLFFLVSGLLAAPALHRPWSTIIGPRLANPYYLFVLWSALQGAFFLAGPQLPTDPIDSVDELLTNLVLPSTTLWYLFALPVYFALARVLVDRVPLWLVALAGGALFAAARGDLLPVVISGRGDNLDRVLAYPGFFLVGAFAREQIAAFARGAAPRRVAALAVGFVGASVVIAAAHLKSSLGAPLLAGGLGVALAVSGAAWVAGSATRTAAALSWLGRRTLPIYVLHLPFIAALHAVAREFAAATGGAAPVLVAAWPITATAAAITGSLVAYGALVRLGGRRLFSLPDPLLGPWPIGTAQRPTAYTARGRDPQA